MTYEYNGVVVSTVYPRMMWVWRGQCPKCGQIHDSPVKPRYPVTCNGRFRNGRWRGHTPIAITMTPQWVPVKSAPYLRAK